MATVEAQLINLTAVTETRKSRFNMSLWERMLRRANVHNSKPRVYAFIMDGLCNGFKLEGDYENLTTTARNLPTTVEEKVKITE